MPEELHVYRGVFKNPAGNPSDEELVYFDAVDLESAEAQATEYALTHPFDVFLSRPLEKLEDT